MAAEETLRLVLEGKDLASDDIDRVSGKLNKMSGTASALGGILKKGALAGGVAIAGLGIASLKMAADFDKAFGEVTTLVDLPESQIAGLRSGIKDMAREMGVDAVQATEALYSAISAGVDPSNAIEFLKTNTKLAVGGVTDLNTAVDLTTTVLNAFGLAQEDLTSVSDVLFTGVRLGKTTVEELGGAMFNVAPVAAAAGVSIEEVTAAMAVLTASGTPTSVAATSIRQAIAELGKEGTVANKNFKDIAGVGFREFIAGGGDMVGAMDLLKKAAKEQGVAISDLFGSIEAGTAAQILAGSGQQAFADALDATRNATGATDAAYEKMNATFSRQFALLKGELKGAMLELGEKLLPLLISGMQRLTPWLREKIPQAVDVMRQAWENVRPTVELVGAVLATLARIIADDVLPIMTKIFNFLNDNREILAALAIAIGLALVPAFVAWAVAAGAAAIATIAATLPIIAIVAAIALLVFGIIKLVQNWDKVTAFIVEKALWFSDMVVGAFQAFIDFITDAWAKTLGALSTAWSSTLSFLIDAWNFTWDIIKDAASAAWGVIVGLFNTGKDLVTSALQAALDFVVNHWKEGLLIALTGPIGLAIVLFKIFKDDIIDILETLVTKALEFGKDIPKRIWEGIKEMKDFLLDNAADFVKDLIGLLNPANWKFSPENMVQIFAKQGRLAGEAMMGSLGSALTTPLPRLAEAVQPGRILPAAEGGIDSFDTVGQLPVIIQGDLHVHGSIRDALSELGITAR
ncbi:hypothetical protein LCGC14_0623160 [marine sediment metagenome]|uniref:Phage tail tape measure protein domain-containing protein n=1 Tax=marine sediment metagenome TaxID=412755 RepID=A0A0F9R9A9_9ZZZZ